MDRPASEPELPDRLARALASASGWPGADAPVDWIQTHISHVFLVGDRVYKMRKAVALGFLDFSQRAERNADCLREIALNRRLAPSVYLGVAPVHWQGERVCIGPVGETIEYPDREHFVVMRRLPEGHDAQTMLERGTLTPRHVESVSERLRSFHERQRLGRPAPWSETEWRERIAAPTLASLESIASSGLVPDTRVAAAEAATRERLSAIAPALEQRRLEGRAVDGHGDLHLDHIWFEAPGDEPLLIDCLEFDEVLRQIDAAAEVAFLAMDLRYRGRPDLAEYFLADYAGRTDDYGLYTVVDFYTAYRALVRAKVAALAAGQSSVPSSQREAARLSLEAHLALAESLFDPRDSAQLVLLCGTVGCGKSSVARALAQRGDGAPIASDRVRKVIAALPPDHDASAEADRGLYRPDRRARVYEALFERALPVLESGRSALLDASFTERAERDRARDWAERHGFPVRLIEVRCAPDVALERLRARKQAGSDPSDAGPEFLETSLARFQPPDEWPAQDRRLVRTDEPDWAQQLAG